MSEDTSPQSRTAKPMDDPERLDFTPGPWCVVPINYESVTDFAGRKTVYVGDTSISWNSEDPPRAWKVRGPSYMTDNMGHFRKPEDAWLASKAPELLVALEDTLAALQTAREEMRRVTENDKTQAAVYRAKDVIFDVAHQRPHGFQFKLLYKRNDRGDT